MKRTLKNIGILMFAVFMAVITGCSSNKGFENGVYYSEKDHNVSITVSDITDLTDNKYYAKSCKVQFSDTYDFTELTHLFSDLIYNDYTLKHSSEFENLSDEELVKKTEEVIADIEKNIDLKKQFSENACTFYFSDLEDNDFDIIEAPLNIDKYGNDNELCLMISIYDDGHLRVQGNQDQDIFTR